jgi:hypothetical protein
VAQNLRQTLPKSLILKVDLPRSQRYGSAVSVQLDFSGKHEPKIANQRASFSASFLSRHDCL